ncbi:MAG: hypothetical protein AAGE94_13360, partial [Acidobacteriota bacterium]
MSILPELTPLLAAVRDEIGDNWDVEASMGIERARSLAFGRLIDQIHRLDRDALGWSTVFVARRGLDCWDDAVRDRRPRRVVDGLAKHLVDGRPVDWPAACEPIASPLGDCRWGPTQAAADAVAACARYLSARDPIDAMVCVSSVDLAFDAWEAGDGFR